MLKKKMNRRSQLLGAIFVLLFFGIISRFYYLQVVEAAFYQEKAEKGYNREAVLKAKRGTIFDRNGETLAQEASSYTAVAILSKDAPHRVTDPKEVANKLAPILGMSEQQLFSMMSKDGLYQVELRPGGWKLSREKMQEIKKLELPGIIFIEEPKRYYPNHMFASHVLGFLNNDGKPVMGLESSLNDQLRGVHGEIKFSKDGKGNRLPQGVKGIQPPADGKNVYLTIDERIQLYVEQALDEVDEIYSPEKMTVLVARPQTGEILAMSSRPSFNPNDYSSIENYVNHAVSSTFEPGSTFKIITLAAAIEEGIYNGEATYQSGSIKVPGGIIRDHNKKGWGRISFLEGVQKSSNVAFTILGYKEMPKEVFYYYINRFGFGEITGIDLPNEKKGYVKPASQAYAMDVATMTFGQGVSVTSIQQVAAVNAIANGGKLLKPYIIERIEEPTTGEVLLQNKPEIVYDQVVSKNTAKEVANILETVVTHGTGQNFYLEGYQVAGKTGTAQKVGDDGKYVAGKYIHSFIGFAPKDDPQIVVYVAVDAPKVEEYYLGGSVVAQVFKSVMQNSLQYLSVEPKIKKVSLKEELEEKVTIPDFRNVSIMDARNQAEESGYETFVLGDGTTVSAQSPAPGSKVYPNERVYLVSGEVKETSLPNFIGWSLREVKDWANMAKVQVKSQGTGYVVSQGKDAGELVKKGGVVIVGLEPKYREKQEE
jgi:penicillin-binding protein 2B